jgi:hypothetical protein
LQCARHADNLPYSPPEKCIHILCTECSEPCKFYTLLVKVIFHDRTLNHNSKKTLVLVIHLLFMNLKTQIQVKSSSRRGRAGVTNLLGSPKNAPARFWCFESVKKVEYFFLAIVLCFSTHLAP